MREFRDGDYFYGAEATAVSRAPSGNGVVSGATVTQRAAGANMSVDVADGIVQISELNYAVVTGNVAISASHATHPRLDLVTVDASGSKTVTAGTPSSPPIAPAIPSGHILLAVVRVAANATIIENQDIFDGRVIVRPTVKTYMPGFQGPATGMPFDASSAASGARVIRSGFGVIVIVTTSGTAVFVYKSTDGGKTWTNITPAAAPVTLAIAAGNGKYIDLLLTSATDYSLLYLNTTSSAVFSRTTNGGTSWTTNNTAVTATTTCVRLQSATVGYALSYVTTTLSFRKTTDAGVTWSAAVTFSTGAATSPSSQWWDVASSDGTNIYIAYRSSTTVIGLRKSTDGGASWGSETVINAANNNATSIHIVAVSATELLYFFFCDNTQNDANLKGGHYIRRSTDSGANWTTLYAPKASRTGSIAHFDEANIAVLLTSTYMVIYGQMLTTETVDMAHLSISEDGGATWPIDGEYHMGHSGAAAEGVSWGLPSLFLICRNPLRDSLLLASQEKYSTSQKAPFINELPKILIY